MANKDDLTKSTKDLINNEKNKKIKKEPIHKISDKDKIKELQNEIEDLKKQRLIDLANIDNKRKQYETDFVERQKYAVSSFIKNLLPAFDMFSSTLNSSNVSPELKNWLKGFEMIEKMFIQEFNNVGVTEIEIKIGDDFNSNFHNAIETVKANDLKNGTIAKVLNKGYLINGRLLRPTNVVVVNNDIKKESIKNNKNTKNK